MKDLKDSHSVIRVSKSGDIFLNELETNIIDTRDFQLLRNKRQLGATSLVYPSASHSKMEHSLGTLYLTQKILKEIEKIETNQSIPKDLIVLIRLFALLHQMVELPFNLSYQIEVDKRIEHHELGKKIGAKSGIGKIIKSMAGQEILDRLMNVFYYSFDRKINLAQDHLAYDIVYNEAGAKLNDSIKRDSHACGIILGYR